MRKQTKANRFAAPKKQYFFEAPILPAKIKRDSKNIELQDESIDLNSLLMESDDGLYMVEVSGDSMIDESIYPGDVLIVDSNMSPKDGLIVIASLDGEMTVKILRKIEGKVYLEAANKKYLPIEITPYCKFEIQGVVRHIIHNV